MPKIGANPPKSNLVEPRDEWSSKRELLTMTLSIAVPMWVDRIRNYPWEYIIERAKVCSDFIAEHGDNLLFKSKKKGETAEAFNHLAEGIACLSFAPGGVKVWGCHWESCLREDFPKRFSEVIGSLAKSIQSLTEE